MRKKFLNKKKINFFNFNLFIFLILFTLSIFVIVNFENFFKISINLIEVYSTKYDYTFNNIKINNLKNLEEKELLNYIEKYKGKSIFLVPLKKIIQNINTINWVKNVKVTSNYKNTLYFFVDEEEPIGVFVNNNQNILFSKNFVVLEIIKNDTRFSNLIRFHGKNSINYSKDLFFKLEKNFLPYIKSASLIGERRWNLKLHNSIILKLPEDSIEEAIVNYKKIYANLSNKELKDIYSIDLRIKSQAIIKYKE